MWQIQAIPTPFLWQGETIGAPSGVVIGGEAEDEIIGGEAEGEVLGAE
jgi:hypothetical protein